MSSLRRRTFLRRGASALLALVATLGLLVGCARNIDGAALPTGAYTGNNGDSAPPTEYSGTDRECERLDALTIVEVVGGAGASPGFSGANCRWIIAGAPTTGVMLAWYEWGDLTVEKETAQDQGYETENVRIASQTAFTQRDPERPHVCGVTAVAPEGIFTWFVEPLGPTGGDPCAAPTKLMELILTGGL